MTHAVIRVFYVEGILTTRERARISEKTISSAGRFLGRRSATDAEGRKLEAVVLEAPSRVRLAFDREDCVAGYINYYVCNGAVFAPEFGDPRTDAVATRELQRGFPDHEVV